MRKFKYIIPVLILALIGYRYLCPKKVEVTPVTRGPAVKAIYATGTVESSEMLPLAPRVAGRIEELLSDEGSMVKEGQVLVRLEADESKALQEQLKSRVDIAKREFSRQENLLKSIATTRELFDRARSELDVAEGALNAELARRDYLTIRAPKDGTIIKRDGELGQFIPSNQTIFWFSSEAPLRISAEVDEEDISQVKENQKVLIRSDAFKDRVFEGKVASITPKGDPIARSYRVRISFNEQVPLSIGMTAENNIIIREETNALLVPTTSLVKDSIWVAMDSKIEKRSIEVGAKGGELSEVIKGVDEGDLVLVTPDANLKDGERVRTRLSKNKK